MTLSVQLQNRGPFGSIGYMTVDCDRLAVRDGRAKLHVTRIIGGRACDSTVYRHARDIVGVKVR
jgi:hypothetical protein